MVERIKRVMDTFELTPTQFADELGVSRSILTHVFNKRNQPSLDLAMKLLKAFPEIKTEWLILGMGDMMRDEMEVKKIKQKENEKKQVVDLDLFSQIDKQPETEDFFDEDEFENTDKILPEIIENQENEDVLNDDIPIKEERKVRHRKTKSSNAGESNIRRTVVDPSNLRDSQTDKKTVVKIVFFYSDNSFDIFHNS